MTTTYDGLKDLARRKRREHAVATRKFGLIKIREIYRKEGVPIDYLKLSTKIRAIYMCDNDDPSVAVNKHLPNEPKLFSLVHELKHHYVDRDRIERGEMRCGDYNANREIEIGAEIFAAEFIYPESEFLDDAANSGLKPMQVSPEDVVQFKKSCQAPVSYKFLTKRLERLGFINQGQFSEVKFQKLEEEVFGLPIYKQTWFRSYRSRRARAASRN